MVLMLVLAMASATTTAAALDGHWEAKFPCTAEAARGLWAEKCAEAGGDYFELNLWSEGDRLCGTHAATAHLGNRVDEDETWTPSIAGRMKDATAVVRFHSHWGAWGHAEVRVRRGKLFWKVLDQDDGMSWMPDEAELKRTPGTDGKPPSTCSGEVPAD